jgi:hypothetical protein
MDDSSPCQNRRSRRSKVLLAATLENVTTSLPVTLRNLSAEGVLVEGDDLPSEGVEVVFRRKDLCASGEVVWVNGRHAGIAFRERLQPEQVLRHVPQPQPKVMAKHRRPGLSRRELTNEERRLAESWVWATPLAAPGE